MIILMCDWSDVIAIFSFMCGLGVSIKETYTLNCVHYSDRRMRTLNIFRNMTLDRRIDLESVHHHFPHLTTLYRGRPEMVVMRMSNGRNLQLFRKGTVQILGPLSDSDVQLMRCELLNRLWTLPRMTLCSLSAITISNMVICAQLNKTVKLHHIRHSNATIIYEVELFPAAVIRLHRDKKVTDVFSTGEVIMTGVTSLDEGFLLLQNITQFLTDEQLLF